MKWLRYWFDKSLRKKPEPQRPSPVFFTNTLTGNKELFISQKAGNATMYTCGPTVYGPVHIGNLRAFWLSDMLSRTLALAGFSVRRVINITDFGHLVTDGDEGEDKMTKGLKREGLEPTLKNMRMMAEKYALQFIEELAELNIPTDEILFPRASDYIPEQIALVATLEQKGYAYRTKNGVYFDTSKFPTYGALGHIHLTAQESVREVPQAEKRNLADFVLWKPHKTLGWESPWGLGFPGWHIECSAMSRALLGQELDIHTGGEDLIHIHHNNEIAQSEAASGRPFVRYWLHNAFLTMAGEKASKSLGNVVYLSEVTERGIEPLALRYFFLQAHYRTPLSFSWEALEGAASGLMRLRGLATDIQKEARGKTEPSEARTRLLAQVRDDLATPQALGDLWESIKSEEYTPEEKLGMLEAADAHFGLSLFEGNENGIALEDAPADIRMLVEEREKARTNKQFDEADKLRKRILKGGYRVDDTADGPVLVKEK